MLARSTVARLAETVRRDLEAAGDPIRAPLTQRYMKSTMPYRGVSLPETRRLAHRAFAAHPLPDRTTWQEAVLELWRDASYREERYAAIELTGYRAYAAYQDPDVMPLYEELIVTGAWWDYVDEVATRRVGPLLLAHREPMTRLMRLWSHDPDLWKRRTAVICQSASKAATDPALLADCIDATIGDRDFFIRKGIGWALREYGKVDPAWVRAFVEERGERLSPLSQREALKYV